MKEELMEETDIFSFKRLIINPQYSDTVFIIGQPPQKILGHSFIVESRCPSILKNSRKKKNSFEVDVNSSISLPRFQDILNFIYIGSIDFSKMKDEEIISLLSACNKYEGLERLEYLCQDYLKKSFDTKNIHSLLKATNAANLKSLKEAALYYAVLHYKDFVANKAAVRDLDVHLFQEVVSLQASELKPLPEVMEPSDKFIEDFKSIYDSTKQADITFHIPEPNAMGITGSIIRAHKAILVGRAPGLQSLVNQIPVDFKSQSVVVVKGLSPESFEFLLKWIYYNETQIPTIYACELISFCQQYNMFSLQKKCLENVKNNIREETVFNILNISYLKENMPSWFIEEMELLKPKCIQYAATHLKDLNIEILRTKKLNSEIAPDILLFQQKKEDKVE